VKAIVLARDPQDLERQQRAGCPSKMATKIVRISEMASRNASARDKLREFTP
jgi:hypothetical protein